MDQRCIFVPRSTHRWSKTRVWWHIHGDLWPDIDKHRAFFLWHAHVMGSFAFPWFKPMSVLVAPQGLTRAEGFVAVDALVLPFVRIKAIRHYVEMTFSLHSG